MLENKRIIINKIKNLEEKDFNKIILSKEFNDLFNYYRNNNLTPVLSIDDIISNIDDVYLEGDLTYLIKSLFGYKMTIYTGNDENIQYIMDSFHVTGLSQYIKIPDSSMIKGLMPEDGLRVYLDIEQVPSCLQFIAKKIEVLDHKVYPIKICPKCKFVSNSRDDTPDDFCPYCSSQDKPVLLTITTDAKEARELVKQS